jgi:hypothetical protein
MVIVHLSISMLIASSLTRQSTAAQQASPVCASEVTNWWAAQVTFTERRYQISLDVADEFVDRGEAACADYITLQVRQEALDEIEPGR